MESTNKLSADRSLCRSLLTLRRLELERRAGVDKVALNAVATIDQILLETFSPDVLYDSALLSEPTKIDSCQSDYPELEQSLVQAWEDRPAVVRSHLRSVR